MRELFATKTCPYCREVRERLKYDGVEFVEHDVEADSSALARLKKMLGTSVMVPVFVEEGRVIEVGVGGRGCYVDSG